MGVGYPIDIILGAIQGVDMFDCVFPTRTARFGTAFTSFGEIKVKKEKYSKDFGPLDKDCDCEACKNYTRAYLHMIQKHDNFCHLLSIHNIHFNFKIMKNLRKAISEHRVP
jgi:queuine tRNA-ribosyltransferase